MKQMYDLMIYSFAPHVSSINSPHNVNSSVGNLSYCMISGCVGATFSLSMFISSAYIHIFSMLSSYFFLLNAAHSTFSIFVEKKTIATRTLSHRHTHTHERAFTSIHASKIQLIHISVAPLKQPTHILSQIQKRFGSPKVLCMVKMRPQCQQSHTHTASIASIDFFSLVRCDSLLSCKSCTDL